MSSELTLGCPGGKIGCLICAVEDLPAIAAATELACDVGDSLGCISLEVYPVATPCDCSLSSLFML